MADAVAALLSLLDEPGLTAGEIFNIGNTQEVSINQLAETVIQRADTASTITHVPYSQAYAPGFEDMRRRVPDTGKIQKAVGWQTTRDLNRILDDVIEYELQHL